MDKSKFMNFKQYIMEIVDLIKPTGKVVKKSITKDAGTNVARKIIQFSYTTKLGNVVKLQFEPKYDDGYEVIFYVNDVLYDNAPRLNADQKPKDSYRDTEILPSVFFLLKTKADKLNAKYLTFRAHSSSGDTKIVRNLDTENPKKEVLLALNQFEDEIKDHLIHFIEPSENTKNLYKKLNKPLPDPKPDLDKSLWLNWISKVKLSIENNKDLQEYIDNLLTAKGMNTMPLNIDNLIFKLKELNNAIISNTEIGYRRTINRRASIYTKILNRDFSHDWNIEIKGDRFTLTRK